LKESKRIYSIECRIHFLPPNKKESILNLTVTIAKSPIKYPK